LRTTDEAVMSVSEGAHLITQQVNKNNEKMIHNDTKNCVWLLDSGATSHMVSNKTMFKNFEEDKRDISLADKEGKKLKSDGRG